MSKRAKRIESMDSGGPFAGRYALAIGMFDGFHRGHKRVLEKCVSLAKRLGAKPAILTFDPHPSAVVKMPYPPAEMLFDPRSRARMFLDAGAENVFVKKFDKKFASSSARKFAEGLSKKFPKLCAIVTGENFLFGRNAEGDAKTMREICGETGWKYAAVPRVKSGGRRISSTRLREALKRGDMPLYKRLAGRPYEAAGKVESGRRIGRKLGFPTLNLPWNPACKPPYGAYAGEVVDAGGKAFPAVVGYGTAPSAGGEKPLIEAHVLGGTKLKTGSQIGVRLLKFLRPQAKFPTLEDLERQIAADAREAKKFFRGMRARAKTKK